jgi:hypothetical protein
MPHIVLEGPADMEAFWRAYKPINDRSPAGDILRTAECWLNNFRTSVMIDAVVIERGVQRHFYVLAADKGGRVTVHLEMLTQPPPGDAVKRLLARIAADLKRQFPALVYGKTNIAEFLLP